MFALAIGALLPVAAVQATPDHITNGLVGEWRMTPTFFAPTGQTLMLDTSGFGRHGSIHGGNVSSYGWMGLSANLDGDKYVQVPNSANLNVGTGYFTLAAWVRISDATRPVKTIINNRGSDGRGYAFAIEQGQYLSLNTSSATGTAEAMSDGVVPLVPGRWHHVAVSVDGSRNRGAVSFYIDGIPSGHGSRINGNIENTDMPFYIGGHHSSADARFDDRIDEVFVYNRALPDWEVWQILSPGLPMFTPMFWSGGLQQNRNNCYNYAANRPTRTYAQPGRASIGMPISMSCAALSIAAIADGLEPIDEDAAFYFKGAVALVAGDIGGIPDFHWYRRDANGMWSHKPGQFVPRNTDNSGEPINNPRIADHGGYTFCGFFLVWTDTVEGSGHEHIL